MVVYCLLNNATQLNNWFIYLYVVVRSLSSMSFHDENEETTAPIHSIVESPIERMEKRISKIERENRELKAKINKEKKKTVVRSSSFMQ